MRIRPAILLAFVAFAVPALGQTAAGWSHYGGNAGGTKYSPLHQITPANASRLTVAWTFRTGETGKGFPGGQWTTHMTFEATPILYDGTLYLTTSETNVVAIDAATGKLRWRHESHVPRVHYSDAASRGVSLWVDGQTPATATCHARIIAPTLAGRMLELDAATGKPCTGFGRDGVLDLRQHVRLTPGKEWRNYLVTSPPVVIGDKIVTGSSVGDNRGVKLELGIVRAFDARTGKLLWSWDPIPRTPANPVYKQWSPEAASVTGAANAWGVLSADPAHHIVYVPTGSASPDMYGGNRPGDDRWANSLVALDADTGKIVWARQLIHHDLWDYDLAAQPVLAELDHDGKTIPAVIQGTKTGMIYTFNRLTGKPVFPITERPVPTDGVPGEKPSPTQPFPAAPPPLVRQGPVTPSDAWGLTYWDELWCRESIKQYHSEGIFTPPSLEGSIEQPGYAGGIEWGGLAFDPHSQVAVVNTNDLPMLVALIPRDKLEAEYKSGNYKGWDFSRMAGTPYGMRRKAFMSPLGIPCVKPPWGELTAVDMKHGKILWKVPLGVSPGIHFNIGVPGMGGPIVTGGGLVFVAATMDGYIRAFDLETGKKVWQYPLPAGGQATPMTYSAGGRQYVAIVAGGHGGLGTKRGDYVIAFALPQNEKR